MNVGDPLLRRFKKTTGVGNYVLSYYEVSYLSSLIPLRKSLRRRASTTDLGLQEADITFSPTPALRSTLIWGGFEGYCVTESWDPS